MGGPRTWLGTQGAEGLRLCHGRPSSQQCHGDSLQPCRLQLYDSRGRQLQPDEVAATQSCSQWKAPLPPNLCSPSQHSPQQISNTLRTMAVACFSIAFSIQQYMAQLPEPIPIATAKWGYRGITTERAPVSCGRITRRLYTGPAPPPAEPTLGVPLDAPLPPHAQPAPPPALTATGMPARTRSHPHLPVHPPLHPPGVAPGPFQDAALQPWSVATPATSRAGPSVHAPPPTEPPGARTRGSTQEDLEAGLSWEDSQELPYKAQRPQTKTERQQMLNKAAQQRCASNPGYSCASHAVPRSRAVPQRQYPIKQV